MIKEEAIKLGFEVVKDEYGFESKSIHYRVKGLCAISVFVSENDPIQEVIQKAMAQSFKMGVSAGRREKACEFKKVLGIK